MTRSPLAPLASPTRSRSLPPAFGADAQPRRRAARASAAMGPPRWLTPLAASAMLVLAIVAAETAQAACTPDPPSDDDLVVCDGTDSTGFDASGATRVTITTDGAALLDDSSALDAAILVSDDNDVTIGADATINVVDPDGAGIRGGDRNDVTLDGTITVEATATRGVAIDMGGGADVPEGEIPPTFFHNGTITLLGDEAIGIRTNDNNDVAISSSAVIQITGDRGIGVRTGDDNIVDSRGAFTIDGEDGVAIQIGSNTGLPIPNGASSAGSITINGAGGTGIISGDNSGVSLQGSVDLLGAMGRGLLAGNKTRSDAEANITNQATITVEGADSIGLSVGDGWIDGGAPYVVDFQRVVNPNAIVNGGDILVSGANAIGILTGSNASNTDGDHNSFVANLNAINVTGTDAIGVSLGGNNVLDPGDAVFANRYSFENLGDIEGDENAGPLVEFRNSFGGVFENRVLNRAGATIIADRSNPPGTPNRGIAILGTDGIERIDNFGAIEGEVRLGAGADIYRHGPNASLTGVVRGEAGDDTAVLAPTGGPVRSFDLSLLDAFEALQIEGLDPTNEGWALLGTATFMQPIEVLGGGVLNAAVNPVTLGGDLVLGPQSGIRLRTEGGATPLTIGGATTFAGTLVVEDSPAFDATGSYRLIDVNGSLTPSRFANEFLLGAGGFTLASTSYDANGLSLVVFVSPDFVGAAAGANRISIARHLDRLQADPSTPGTVTDQLELFSTGTGDLNDLYDALSPEPYDAQTTLVVEGNRQVTSLLLDRPRDCRPGQLDPWQASARPMPCHARSWAPWVAAIGGFRDRDGFAGHPEYESHIGGLVFGVDTRPLPNLELTLAVSSQRGQVDVTHYGESDLVLANLSGHATWDLGPVRLQGVVSWGHGSHNSRRLIRFDESDNPVNVNARDDFNSQHVAVSGRAGWLIEAGSIDIEPLIGFDYTWISQDEVRERDAGLFGLVVDDREDDVLSAVAGVRFRTLYHHTRYIHTSLLWMDGVWQPTVDLRWRQTFSGYDRDVTARLANAPDTVSAFTIEGKEDKRGFEVSAGLSFVPEAANRLQLELRYDAFRGSHTIQHDLVAKVRLGF